MSDRYVWRRGQFVNRATGEPMDKPFAGQIVAPNVMPDIPEYASPIDGRVITSRSERLDDLKRNNCVEAGDLGCSPTGGKIRNKAFAAKRGLTVSEEYR